MLLLTASKRGAQGAINHPGSLQPKRGFLFFPYCHRRSGPTKVSMPWRWRRSRSVTNPEKLLFMLRSTEPQKRTAWAKRWEYEAKDGVVKESTSEFVPGKGWVNTETVSSEGDPGSHESQEFDIDLITLRRVPRRKVAPEIPSVGAGFVESKDTPQKAGKDVAQSKGSSSKTVVTEVKKDLNVGATVTEGTGSKKEPKVVLSKDKTPKPETKPKTNNTNEKTPEAPKPESKPKTNNVNEKTPEASKPEPKPKTNNTSEKTPETPKPESKPKTNNTNEKTPEVPNIPATPKKTAPPPPPSPPPPKQVKPSDLEVENFLHNLKANLDALKAQRATEACKASPGSTTSNEADGGVSQDLPRQPVKTSSTSERIVAKTKSSDSTKMPKESAPLQPQTPVENVSAPTVTSGTVLVMGKAGETAPSVVSKASEPHTATKPPVNKKSQGAKISTESTSQRAPEQVEEKAFKPHRLNIGKKLKGDLDSPDADIDLLVPSDVRAAAGAPGKIISKVESEAEKDKRRKVMAAEFDGLRREDVSETLESPGAVRDRMRVKAASLGLQNAGLGAADLKKKVSSTAESGKVAPSHESPSKESTTGQLHERDYEWSGTEDVSTEDVLKPVNLKVDPTKPMPPTPPAAVKQAVPEIKSSPVSKPPPPPAAPPQNYYILVRNPESGSMHFANLPSMLISESLTRENTAFDALRGLNSPDSFLPLWRVLQKGGFTVVGGEKDCLIVKVDADGSRAKQIAVLKEIKLKLSPAEAVARESWGKKKEKGSITVVGGEGVKIVVPPSVATLDTNQKVEEKVEEQTLEKQAPVVGKVKVKKSRPFRRVFWAAVWVGACSGAATMGLETLL